jgi:hypothetical protein
MTDGNEFQPHDRRCDNAGAGYVAVDNTSSKSSSTATREAVAKLQYDSTAGIHNYNGAKLIASVSLATDRSYGSSSSIQNSVDEKLHCEFHQIYANARVGTSLSYSDKDDKSSKSSWVEARCKRVSSNNKDWGNEEDEEGEGEVDEEYTDEAYENENVEGDEEDEEDNYENHENEEYADDDEGSSSVSRDSVFSAQFDDEGNPVKLPTCDVWWPSHLNIDVDEMRRMAQVDQKIANYQNDCQQISIQTYAYSVAYSSIHGPKLGR